MTQWLMCWIPNPGVPSLSFGGRLMSTRNGFAALRQLNPIHKNGPQSSLKRALKSYILY